MSQKRFALCIGNNEYQSFDKLDYAINDSNSVADLLEKYGFTVQKLENITHDDLPHISDTLDYVLEEEYDVFLFYYAGHGLQVNGTNYLIAVDSQVSFNENKHSFFDFDLRRLLDKLDEMSSIIKIVILDCCRDASRGTNPFGFAPIRAPQNTIVAFSTSPNSSAFEDHDKQHGKYTSVLLEMLGLPRTPIETMFKKVRQRLLSLSGGRQVSWEHSSLISEFYINTDTADDCFEYTIEAYKDSLYLLKDDNLFKSVIEKLKTHNYYTQNDGIDDAISLINSKPDLLSKNDLFVFGRNVLQSADGNSWRSQYFIEELNNFGFSDEIKNHILCGILYEMYFDKNNQLRVIFKTRMMDLVFKNLFQPNFYDSRIFINKILGNHDDVVLLVPNSRDVVSLDVNIQKTADHEYRVSSIFLEGQQLSYSCSEDFLTSSTISDFKTYISKIIVCPESHLRIHFSNPVFITDKISYPATSYLFL